jgi:hypothetical protein
MEHRNILDNLYGKSPYLAPANGRQTPALILLRDLLEMKMS